MRKIITLLLTLSLAGAYSQTVIVEWNFPDNSADVIADGGIEDNLTREISTEGGTSAIDFKTGYTGKAAQASGWDNGNGLKCWVIEFTTTGYDQLTISSLQISGGTNPGPRDFIIQFRIGQDGSWEDVPGSEIVTANDWTTAVIDNLAIPAECADQDLVYLRWVMTSDTNSVGGIVEPTGISKIDNIVVLGQSASGLADHPMHAFSVYPNPAHDRIFIQGETENTEVSLTDISGRLHFRQAITRNNQGLDISFLPEGLYFIRLTDQKGTTITKKLVVR